MGKSRSMGEVIEVLGVYDADGGLRGEVSYAFGKLLRGASCGLCNLTHAGVRRRPEWDAMVRELAVPVRVAHRNELTADEQEAVAASGPPPIVLGRTDYGDWQLLLEADRLSWLNGSISAFERELLAVLPH